MLRTIVVLLSFCLLMGGCSFVRLDAVEASIAADAPLAASYEIGTIENTMPIVEAMVNGQGPYRLILDTGASVSAIKPEIVEALKLRRDGKARFYDIHGRDANFVVYRADTVRLGSIELNGLPIITSDHLSGLFDDMKIDGLLGYYGLDQFTLDLDYESGVVAVSTIPLDRNSPGVIKMIARRDGTPVINITHTLPGDGGSFTLPYGIDSGGGGFALSIDSHSKEKLVDLSRVRRFGGSKGLNGTELTTTYALMNGRVDIASFELRNVPINLDNAHTLIGVALLSQFRVQIDPRSRLVRFTKAGKTNRVGTITTMYGIGVLDTLQFEDTIVLTRIGDQTPAMLAGLRPKDRVLEIDGQPATEQGVVRKLGWYSKTPTKLTLLIERDGESFEVEVGMEPLFPEDMHQRGPDLELPSIDLSNGTIEWSN